MRWKKGDVVTVECKGIDSEQNQATTDHYRIGLLRRSVVTLQPGSKFDCLDRLTTLLRGIGDDMSEHGFADARKTVPQTGL